MLVASVLVGKCRAVGSHERLACKTLTHTQCDPLKSLQGGSRGFEPLNAHRKWFLSCVGTLFGLHWMTVKGFKEHPAIDDVAPVVTRAPAYSGAAA
jgi:hypothetical protein